MRIGKTKIDIRSRGCIGCGTEHSHDWQVARTLNIQINGSIYRLEIHRCGDCIEALRDSRGDKNQPELEAYEKPQRKKRK